MAKDEPEKPKPLTEQQVQVALNDVGRSPTNMKRFIAQQLMTYAADNNGEIDVTTKELVDGIATLMTAVQTKSQKERGIGVLSIAQTETDMTRDIQNAIARGADPQLFEPAKALLLSVKSELADKVKSNKGVASLVGEFIKEQSLVYGIPFMKKTGTGLVPQEKADLIAQLAPHITFPENVSPFVRKDTTFVPNIVSPKAQARMAEFFSVEGKLSEFGSCTLDPSKLTPENMKKFGDAFSKDLEIMAVVEQAKKEVEGQAASIIEQSLKELEKKGHKILPGTRTEIFAELMPSLTSLGSEYLASNNGNLVKELAASLDKGKAFNKEKTFKEDFTIAEKDLNSVAKKINAGHLKKSNEAAVKQYQKTSLVSNAALSENLNKLLEARGEKPISPKQFKKLSNKDFAKYRKVDPKEFDKVMFGIGAEPVVARVKPVVKEVVPVGVVVPPKPEKLSEGPPLRSVSSPPSLVTPPILAQPSVPKLETARVVATTQKATVNDADKIAKEIIGSSIKAEGHKITPERVEKITKALAPTLAKLGPEYLEKNKGDLTKELTASLKSGQGYSTSFTGSYTVSTAELGKIATKIGNQHQPKAQLASVEKVKDMVWKNVMTNGDVAAKLNSFVKKTGIKRNGKPLEEFNAKTVPNNETIAKIRLVNSKEFDSIFNASPKLSPNLAKQASVVGHSHGLPHPPPGRGGKTTKPLPPPSRRPQSQGPGGVGGL